MLLGWRPLLVGWRWRQSLGWRPLLLGFSAVSTPEACSSDQCAEPLVSHPTEDLEEVPHADLLVFTTSEARQAGTVRGTSMDCGWFKGSRGGNDLINMV